MTEFHTHNKPQGQQKQRFLKGLTSPEARGRIESSANSCFFTAQDSERISYPKRWRECTTDKMKCRQEHAINQIHALSQRQRITAKLIAFVCLAKRTHVLPLWELLRKSSAVHDPSSGVERATVWLLGTSSSASEGHRRWNNSIAMFVGNGTGRRLAPT